MKKINYKKVVQSALLLMIFGISCMIDIVVNIDIMTPFMVYLSLVLGVVACSMAIMMSGIYTILYFNHY